MLDSFQTSTAEDFWAEPVRPLLERQHSFIRRQKIETFLGSRNYVLFPGMSYDLTDKNELAVACDWMDLLLEEMGL